MKKWTIGIGLTVIILAAGAYLFRGRWKERRPWVYDKAGFIASVQVEGRKAGTSTLVDTAQFWYKNSVIYTLDVEVFQDGDGAGDIKGLIQRLGYIHNLGATVILLAPFQPTSNIDDGYDITDYYAIDPRLGMFNFYVNQYLFYALATGEINTSMKHWRKPPIYPGRPNGLSFCVTTMR